ncbi:histone-lysine N-methyltransferase, H3 lysine-9 specific SUVH5-like [Papaver somniferum]|uniref:histone-lysine N-methyltransferase, H3 lysine-9 specific SUVH5-like n=1 Tax=Papaver somniferum TaxID=3469 RepID=UPI000E703987|nr:histone-lysine N-methyltransferase, H3 lysine-9 specific SUVH5-like [Papaver somniferum]XP_026419047.1 histone-lysine N-methyltransferase, H3 lysine-9 specific SUVH5-like [Papaver somniferum]
MMETLKRPSPAMMESVYGVTSGLDKYKRKRVSSIRDFPTDCFRGAARLEPLVSKSLDHQIELVVSAVKAVETKDVVELSKSLNQMEFQEPTMGSDGLQPQLVMDFVAKDASVPLKAAVGDETSCLNMGSSLKEFPARRRVPAIRDYPIGLSNVPRFSDESLKETSADSDRVKSDPDVMETKAECSVEENDSKSSDTSNTNTSHTSLSKIFDEEIADSGKKWGGQSVTISRSKSLKRKDFEDSVCAENQGGRSIILGTSGERMVIQALMAAKYCPWREGKVDVKSTTTQGTTRHPVKNQGSVPYRRDGEKDARGHDDMIENISSVPRPPCSTSSVIPSRRPISNNGNVVTRSKVRETLRLFQTMFRKLLQGEESKSKVRGALPKRIDLLTFTEMKTQGKCVNTATKILGHVPGVEIGDEFHYRVELCIIGLHGQMQGGIDYVTKDGRNVATSVVSSGGYDDIDNFDVLLYSGHGGNPVRGNKLAEDQKLERGNLALKNSINAKTPVRVIRGFKEMKGPDSLNTRGKNMGITYTYDGLYLVNGYWKEKGRYGNNVFMFELRRMPGQPELALREVQKLKLSNVREGLCVDDISQGEEKMRICAVNTLDSEKLPPFKYIAKMKYTSRHNLIPLRRGCGCTDGCSNSKKCLCTVMNGGGIPYNYNGAIVETKTLVYECGPLCKCPPSCHNRVSQHGIKFQLEIFKTKSKGWGVRSLNSIPSGSFICEYTGELLAEKEADQRTGNDEYLFDLGRSNNQNKGDGFSNLIPPDLQSTSISCENGEDEGFTIDALRYGNVCRFINHSCSPNLIAQNVLYDHADKRMPHIMLFAGDNISPLQELTYDYNYVVDSVHDSAGNIKIKECHCGSIECTGRMY